jgi:hypothetical protein
MFDYFSSRIDEHLEIILKGCEAMEGNKRAEELAKQIREAEKDRKDPNKTYTKDEKGRPTND